MMKRRPVALRVPSKSHRHSWHSGFVGTIYDSEYITYCDRCGVEKNEARRKRRKPRRKS